MNCIGLTRQQLIEYLNGKRLDLGLPSLPIADEMFTQLSDDELRAMVSAMVTHVPEPKAEPDGAALRAAMGLVADALPTAALIIERALTRLLQPQMVMTGSSNLVDAAYQHAQERRVNLLLARLQFAVRRDIEARMPTREAVLCALYLYALPGSKMEQDVQDMNEAQETRKETRDRNLELVGSITGEGWQ